MGLIAALEAVRGRAAFAAAAAGDGTPCGGYSDHGDCLSSSAALEAALEATDVSDEHLQELASALATEAATSFLCLQATSIERRCRLAWLAVARSLTRTQWPPSPSPASSLLARQAPGREQVTSLDTVGQLRRWRGFRQAVPCKHILSGECEEGGDDRAQVTCLTYLPLAMLLASGYSNGRVRLWDPCARKHKIAPPPPYGRGYGTSSGNGRRETAGIRGKASSGLLLGIRDESSSGRHLRIWPGSYVKAAEEWTEEGLTFGCIANFGAVEKSPCRDGDGVGLVKVKALHSIVIPGGGAASLIACDPESARLALRIDDDKPWDPTSAGTFFTALAVPHQVCVCPFAHARSWPREM